MTDKAIRAALLTAKRKDTAAENIADYVADLLRQGRASEITDDLMAQADPQRLHQHYTTGNTGADMPMDYASRMARAASMGFGTKAYHGTPNEYHSAKKGVTFYTTPNPEYASMYGNSSASSMGSNLRNHDVEKPNVIPVMTRNNMVLDTTTPVGRKVFNKDFFMKY